MSGHRLGHTGQESDEVQDYTGLCRWISRAGSCHIPVHRAQTRLVRFCPLNCRHMLTFVPSSLGLVCGSAFFEFLAALFDVSQILVRGAADKSLSSSTAASLLLARDIFFSFGGGLRFFAFWTIVAQRPRNEAPITQRERSSEHYLAVDPSMHSGNWMRWGVVGILLKWVTAAIAVAITLMQILWRAVDEFDNLGPIYAAENGLEVVLSVVFIIKLCLNAAITDTPSRSRWMTLMDYMPLIAALLFNFALGVGNIAVCECNLHA